MERRTNRDISSGMSRNQKKDSLGEVFQIVFSKKNILSFVLIGAKVIVTLIKRSKNSD